MGNPGAATAAATAAAEERGAHSATSGLGLMLAAGAQAAAGSHGAAPSNTSRFFSVDVGALPIVPDCESGGAASACACWLELAGAPN